MITEKGLHRLVTGSIEYFAKNGILTIRDYYNIERKIEIDLNKLTLDMVKQLAPDEEEVE